MTNIYDRETGSEITVGLQGSEMCDEAIQAARRCTIDAGEAVLLADDDGDWIVHPDGSRETAGGDCDQCHLPRASTRSVRLGWDDRDEPIRADLCDTCRPSDDTR